MVGFEEDADCCFLVLQNSRFVAHGVSSISVQNVAVISLPVESLHVAINRSSLFDCLIALFSASSSSMATAASGSRLAHFSLLFKLNGHSAHPRADVKRQHRNALEMFS